MYKIEKMTQDIALHIADDWKYPDEYSFYDMTEDPEDYAEIVSEDLRGDRYYSVVEDGILIGYFCFYEEDEFVEIGLGLRPDLTGQGRGIEFFNLITDFIVNKTNNKRLRLSVAEFNKRAIKVYKKAGFYEVSNKKVNTNGGIYDFVIMEKSETINIEKYLDKFVKATVDILKDNLVGIYLHGSYAMGCYNFKTSDIDVIIVINHNISDNQKILCMNESVLFNNKLGAKGFEMSIVKKEFCNKDIYPIPYELHFSSFHLEEYRETPIKYISEMQGFDEDLSAHFKMVLHRGKKLYGKEIKDVFSDVPDEYYLKSILYDISDYNNEFVTNNFVYVILNLCRTLAYVKERLILSKQEGGEWAIKNTDIVYREIISKALSGYKLGEKIYLNDYKLADEFVSYMRVEISFNTTIEFRLATLSDLDNIKRMYKEIVEKMLKDGLEVWDDIYPVNYIEDDILNNSFYIMTSGLDIMSGVFISKKHNEENSITWKNPKASAMYIDRLGVNINYLNKGIASKTIENILKIAKNQDVEYLRLFVVDKNKPAIKLYEKNRFFKADGIYNEVIDDELVLKQYGYEIGV